MPNIILNNQGRPSSNQNYNGTVPGAGSVDVLLLNQSNASVDVSVRGSSTTMGATLVDATDRAAVTVFAAADRAAGEPVVTATIPAHGYVLMSANKSDAGAGNLQIQTGDLQARHMTSSQVDQAFYISTLN